jgi:hypothetical protein
MRGVGYPMKIDGKKDREMFHSLHIWSIIARIILTTGRDLHLEVEQ